LVLVVIWHLISVPAGKFTESYFAFWVLVAIAWVFGAAIIITILPLTESSEDIGMAVTGMLNFLLCRTPDDRTPEGYNEEEVAAKSLADDDEADATPNKEAESEETA
jgi:hypothetical protein